jgi:hypothetical protein
MKSNLLISFGCSWTYGVGVGYEPLMSIQDYRNIAWNNNICDEYSFRGLLAKKYDCTNINFSVGGSSNQKQFRLAKEFFTNKDNKEKLKQYNKIIVLWAITSTARNEVYSTEKNEMFNFKMEMEHDIPQFFFKNCYSHNNEINLLSTEILFWDEYFNNADIKNIWIDTFNHHDYTRVSENMVGYNKDNRDLLSELTSNDNGSNKIKKLYYHLSSWKKDDPRIYKALKLKLVNPISFHPTKLGHEKIADIISPYIEKLL